MRVNYVLLFTLVAASTVEEEEQHQRIVGEDSSFKCFSSYENKKQDVVVDFIPYGSGRNEGDQVFGYTVNENGQIDVPSWVNSAKYKTDGEQVTIQGIQLADEGTYKCIIRFITDAGPQKSVFINMLTVLVKPTVEEIRTMEEELVDVNDSGAEKRLVNVAKCIANGAKPNATVSWEFENIRGLEAKDTIEFAQEGADRLWSSSSILQIIPEKMYHNAKAVCVVRWMNELPIRTPYVINVQYKPQTPTMKPIMAQNKVSCLSDGNPEPIIMWKLPDGQVKEGQAVAMQSIENPNATYTCTAQNTHGSAFITKTNQELADYTEPVQSADMGIIIGVAIAAVLVLCIIAYLVYRFVLDPHHEKDSEFGGQNIYTGGQRDHFVGGSQNFYPNNRGDHGRKASADSDTDDQSGLDEQPIIHSQNNARYHQARRSNTNIRHSPMRGSSQEKQNYDYIAQPASDIGDNDDIIDDPAQRYADYSPAYYQTSNTAPYKDPYSSIQKGPPINNRVDYNHVNAESHMV